MRISDWSSDVCSSDLFLREQLLHEVGVRAAEENLRTAVLAAHRQNQRADAVADAHQFARDLMVAADHAFGTAEVDDDVAEFDRLDDAGSALTRPEERRIGKACVNTWQSRWSPCKSNQNQETRNKR